MSYISAIRKNDEVWVWERNNGVRELVKYSAPYYFFIDDINGKFISIYGDKLSLITSNNFDEHRNNIRKYKLKGFKIFESDLAPELKILSNEYYGKEASEPNISFLDIEVDYSPDIGFASVANPYAPINSIAFYHKWSNRMVVYAVPPEDQKWTENSLVEKMNEVEALPTDVKLEVYLCLNEKELLLDVLDEIEDSDILSGWNSRFFDVPYLAKRIEKYYKERGLKLLSFPGAKKPKFIEIEKFGSYQTSIQLSGRISIDYLELFKKYEMAERPSYKLEAIADEIVPDIPKLEYKGALHSLYRTNFPWFIRYNLRDTEVLKGFEEHLGYIALANVMVHTSTGLWEHVLGTLKLAELAVNNFCIHERNVRFINMPDSKKESFAGAYVLEPKKGMHDWIGSIDITSLYPSNIRSCNMSPETIIGQFDEQEKACEEIAKNSEFPLRLIFENGKFDRMPASKWRTFLKSKKYGISGFGTVFDQNKKGIVPSILEDWFNTRKKYQKLKKEASDPVKTAYYDRLQYVYKIKLNSFYGALTNPYFRYYDIRLGESTTGTGRMILLHQCAKTNELLTDVYDANGEAILGGDTDSTYFSTFAENEEEAVLIADITAERVNETFQKYMQDTFLCNPGYDNIIQAAREIVASRGIFIEKKLYILLIVDSEGKKVDKLKVMGLQIKKTTIPIEIGKQLNEFIKRLLKGEDWNNIIAKDIVALKKKLEITDDLSLIGLPKGIKGVENYTEKYRLDNTCKLPGHIAAAIHYNLAKDQYKDKESPKITTGMKIRTFYVFGKHLGRFISIALPTDIETIPIWFLENYKIDRKKHIIRLVDMPLKSILNAIGKKVPSEQSLIVNDLLGF